MWVIILDPKNGYMTNKSLSSWNREQIFPMSGAKIHFEKKEKRRKVGRGFIESREELKRKVDILNKEGRKDFYDKVTF